MRHERLLQRPYSTRNFYKAGHRNATSISNKGDLAVMTYLSRLLSIAALLYRTLDLILAGNPLRICPMTLASALSALIDAYSQRIKGF